MSVEAIKEKSRGLFGSLAEQLEQPGPSFDEEGKQILKFHGIYQQSDRDVKKRAERQSNFMLRSKLPGGRLTPEQYLLHDALADEFGQGDFRLTTRQAIQIHGILKGDLRSTLQRLHRELVSTLGACGDVERNIMCCPAPFGDPLRQQLQDYANRIAAHLCPRTPAYHQIWLRNGDGRMEQQTFEADEVVEPIYGRTYLPRKFKTAMAYPGDGCTEVFTNDIGLVGLFGEDARGLRGFNILVGGGMGRTHNKEETFPLLARPLGYAPADRIIDVVEKIVLVQRDHGDRSERRHARMKYLVHEWGIERFRETVEAYLGYGLEPLQPMPAMKLDDHLGWHRQADGRWFYGAYVENGRVQDDAQRQTRRGLREVVAQFRPSIRITGQQNLLLGNIPAGEKARFEEVLARHHLYTPETLSQIRKQAMACPAMPTCGLALAEAERVLPGVIDRVEKDVAELGLQEEEIAIRMTGCPNGCARPYVADVGIVGRSGTRYSLFLGGNPESPRLNVLYRDLVDVDDLRNEIYQVLVAFREGRRPGERIGDWVHRVGIDAVRAAADQVPAAAGG